MNILLTRRILSGLPVLLFLGMIGLGGCGRQDAKPDSSSTATKTTDPIAAGKAVYEASGCTRCHSLGGSGGKMGPDLTHVAADATHTASWLADQVKFPGSHNPSSRMPPYQGQISDADIANLSQYLASLK